MDVDLISFLLMGLCLLAPAGIVLGIFMVLQKRRGKFHRQRITKGQKQRDDE